ncbi:MAG: DegV family protein [Firmicutes bacterium]|nr:DegV family protein [Bacillota bacterium]
MSKFILSTDTCCDDFKSHLKQDNIEYITMSYICEDEVLHDEANSFEDYENFYNEMRNGKVFSTTGLNVFEVREYFEYLLKKYNSDILHICLSSGLSGTYNIVQSVADELNENSENKIYVFDSLCATQPQNILVQYAKGLRDKEMSANEAMEALNNEIQHFMIYFFLNDLDALKRGGRISGIQAMMGKALQLRPLLTFDSEGKLRVIEKIMGTKKAIKTLMDKLVDQYDENAEFPITLAYAGENYVNELKNLVLSKFPNAQINIGPVGPVIASHTGPALTAIIFHSKQTRI